MRIVDATIIPESEKSAKNRENRRLLVERLLLEATGYQKPIPQFCRWRANATVLRLFSGEKPIGDIHFYGSDQHGVAPLPNGPPPEIGADFVGYLATNGEVVALPLAMALEQDPLVLEWTSAGSK
ncbi:hypothetical protein U1769_09685 [Sphingomonas sp. ZT3P38]|uniref:hypothetical protein n=1 Tax=Parasphingomonas zepuensis TaxID=3096161 RepID=UPI002FC7BDD8